MAAQSNNVLPPGAHAKSSKRKRPSKQRQHDPGDGTSTEDLKARIQEATSQLDGSQYLGSDERKELEWTVAECEQELASLEYERRRQKTIRKYHKIRFFERQKASRQLKRLRKQLTALGSSWTEAPSHADDIAVLQTHVHEAEVDLNYALYFPLDQAYVTLYPHKDKKSRRDPEEPDVDAAEPEKESEEDSDEEQEQEKEEGDKPAKTDRAPLWEEVERRMTAGGLDELREGQGASRRRAKQRERNNPVGDRNRNGESPRAAGVSRGPNVRRSAARHRKKSRTDKTKTKTPTSTHLVGSRRAEEDARGKEQDTPGEEQSQRKRKRQRIRQVDEAGSGEPDGRAHRDRHDGKPHQDNKLHRHLDDDNSKNNINTKNKKHVHEKRSKHKSKTNKTNNNNNNNGRAYETQSQSQPQQRQPEMMMMMIAKSIALPPVDANDSFFEE